MAWQTYTDPLALRRMSVGMCPECGFPPNDHTGAGSPRGCLLTDNGVAGRIYENQQRIAAESQRDWPPKQA